MQVAPNLKTDAIRVFDEMVTDPERAYEILRRKYNMHIGYTEFNRCEFLEHTKSNRRTKCMYFTNSNTERKHRFVVESYLVNDSGNSRLITDFWPKNYIRQYVMSPELVIIYSDGRIFNVTTKTTRNCTSFETDPAIPMPGEIAEIYNAEFRSSPVECVIPLISKPEKLYYCRNEISNFGEIVKKDTDLWIQALPNSAINLDVRKTKKQQVIVKKAGVGESGRVSITARMVKYKRRNNGAQNDAILIDPQSLAEFDGEIIADKHPNIVIFRGDYHMEIIYLEKISNKCDVGYVDIKKINNRCGRIIDNYLNHYVKNCWESK